MHSVTRTILLALFLSIFSARAESIEQITNKYLDAYFAMYPARATQAGRHDFDEKLENFSSQSLADWTEFNRATQAKLSEKPKSFDDQLDAEALRGQIDRELNALTNLHRAERDPLFWLSVIADATVFLLVRDDLPLKDRQEHAKSRARLLPAFARAGRDHFAHVDLAQVAPELCAIAATQVRSSAKFYAEGFGAAVNDRDIGPTVATALNEFAASLEDIGKRATGSPRLGDKYAQTFRVGTGVDETPANVLKRAIVNAVLEERDELRRGQRRKPTCRARS